MNVSSRTPEGWPNLCPVCGNQLCLEPSVPSMDAPCPCCGHLLWFADSGDCVAPLFDATRTGFTSPSDLSDEIEIPAHVLELVPESIARESRVLPIGETPSALIIATANPYDRDTIEKLRFVLSREVRVVHVTSKWIDGQLRRRFGDDYY